MAFGPFLIWKRVNTWHILVWNRVWFSSELRERMNLFIVSVPNEWERNRNMRIRNFSLALWSKEFWHNFCLNVRSETRCGKWHFFVWNRIRIYASVNSTCAPPPRPPPPPPTPSWSPGISIFFLPWMANTRGWGLLSCTILRGRDEKRGQMPRPPSTLQHFSLVARITHLNVRFFVSTNVFLCHSARILTILMTTCTSLWF